VAFTQGPLAESFRSSAVVAEWATGAVLRVELAADGASGTVSTFLTGFTNPVPVLSTSDGSLLIGDWTTGTVYQITAATSSTT
jgi:glucose/arabinose dehydrogenase